MTTSATEAASTVPHPPADQGAAVLAASAWGTRSRQLAATGHAWLAAETQWAADLATLHVLLWESGLAAVPDPAAQLDAVAHVIQGSFMRADDAPTKVADVVAWARTALAQAFGAPVDEMLVGRLAPLDHLESLGILSTGSLRGDHAAEARARDLRLVALDCSSVARAMAAAGLPKDARDHIRRAMLATFEAFLLTRPTATGVLAAMVDLRWELAVADLTDVPLADLSLDALGRALVTSVAPCDREELRLLLEKLQ